MGVGRECHVGHRQRSGLCSREELGYPLSMGCPFCEIPESERVIETNDVIGFFDHYPASPGHLLLVPRRHVATWFDADEREKAALLRAIDDALDVIGSTVGRRPDGYNVGFNAGEAAGQTVMPLHIHVIPRYRGDVDHARGGIRGAIPICRIYHPKDGS